jgi:hypothetical protein
VEHTHAVLQIPLQEYLELKEQIKKRDEENTKLQAQLTEALLTDPEGRTKQIHAALQLALPIVGFAVSSLPPESIRGWPYKELAEFGKVVKNIPGLDLHQLEQGKDWVVFANEIRPFEEARARGEIPQARQGGPG